MLRKIHMQEPASLKHFTIVNLMLMKFNVDSCCQDTKLEGDIITKCKKATALSCKIIIIRSNKSK